MDALAPDPLAGGGDASLLVEKTGALFFSIYFFVMLTGDLTTFMASPPTKESTKNDPWIAVGTLAKLALLLASCVTLAMHYAMLDGSTEATSLRLILAAVVALMAVAPIALSGKKKNVQTDDVYRLLVPVVAVGISNFFIKDN